RCDGAAVAHAGWPGLPGEPGALQRRRTRHRMGLASLAASTRRAGDGVFAVRPGTPAAKPRARQIRARTGDDAVPGRVGLADGAGRRHRDTEDRRPRATRRKREGVDASAVRGAAEGVRCVVPATAGSVAARGALTLSAPPRSR